GVRVPLGEGRARRHLVALLHAEEGAVRHGVALTLAAALVDDLDLAVTAHHDHLAIALLHVLKVVELHEALAAVLGRALLDLAARGRTTDVERTHRELRAGLADGLRRDDADGLADV